MHNNKDQYKLILIGPKNSNKLDVAKTIVAIDESFDICPTFNSDIEFKGKTSENFEYYLQNSDVELGYKNKSFLYVTTYSIFSKGISLQDFYNSDIIILDFADFNGISETNFESLISKSNIIFIDAKANGTTKEDLEESYYAFERINNANIKYLYYMNEEPSLVAHELIKFIYAKVNDRKDMIDELYESRS